MKTRIILFLAISAIITLSFTFATVTASKQPKTESPVERTSNEPVGGFVAEDQL